jgi:hypothetical protein
VHPGSASSVNARDREYRLKAIDPLVLLHQFAYHPAFSPLRAAAARRNPPLNLKGMFGERALRARTKARSALEADESSERWAEWSVLASRYPEIESSLPITLARFRTWRRRIRRRTARLVPDDRAIRSAEDGQVVSDLDAAGAMTDAATHPEDVTR